MLAPRARTIERIEDLRHDAEADSEPFSEVSASVLLALIEMPGVSEPDAVFGEDDGTLRAMWRTKSGRLSIDLISADRCRCLQIMGGGGSSFWARSIDEAAAAVRAASPDSPQTRDAPAEGLGSGQGREGKS